ncbi:hypothetical protein BDV95DRAFT_636175 [Massariosphaeria phaeospora]|uniref:Uncharacterized protein n=1 Tax=Massariosphaeria phaeospora TaxID=100035 RepID=A0A7C8MBL2_9PLEO|nr:hypothetical protein BDV95DRAFT_636175 [Massariosphaeria phaeospora]
MASRKNQSSSCTSGSHSGLTPSADAPAAPTATALAQSSQTVPMRLPASDEALTQYLDHVSAVSGSAICDIPLHFTGIGNWQHASDYMSRVRERPDIDPTDDDSILQVVSNREFWTGELYHAMMNLADVKDNDGSSDVRRFVNGAYDARDVEAVCRAIFVAVLDQVVNGYRGSRAKLMEDEDTAEDDRRGSCLTRIVNVVTVLRASRKLFSYSTSNTVELSQTLVISWVALTFSQDNKCICCDVLKDQSQIVDLAYAPLKLAKTKLHTASDISRQKKTLDQQTEKVEELKQQIAKFGPKKQLPGMSAVSSGDPELPKTNTGCEERRGSTVSKRSDSSNGRKTPVPEVPRQVKFTPINVPSSNPRPRFSLLHHPNDGNPVASILNPLLGPSSKKRSRNGDSANSGGKRQKRVIRLNGTRTPIRWRCSSYTTSRTIVNRPSRVPASQIQTTTK